MRANRYVNGEIAAPIIGFSLQQQSQVERQYAAALDGMKAQANNIGADRTVPGTIDELIVSYYRLVVSLRRRPPS